MVKKKIFESDFAIIKELSANGFSQGEIASRFHISQQRISRYLLKFKKQYLDSEKKSI